MWIYKVHFNDFNRENANACRCEGQQEHQVLPVVPKACQHISPGILTRSWTRSGHGGVLGTNGTKQSCRHGSAALLGTCTTTDSFFPDMLKNTESHTLLFPKCGLDRLKVSLSQKFGHALYQCEKDSVGRIHAICYSHKKLYILQFIFRVDSSFYCLSFITLYFWHSKFSRAKVSRKWVTLGQKLWCPLKWGSLDNAHESSFSLKGFLGFGGGFFPHK